MSHPDPDVLAAVALDEAVPEGVLEHVRTCARCAQQCAQLSEVLALTRSEVARSGPDRLGDAVQPPPSRVWAAVEAELGLEPAAGALAPALRALPPPVASSPDGGATAVPTPMPPRRRRLWAWTAAAAAVGLVLGGLGAGWWQRRTAAPLVLASTTLDPLPGWSASGRAAVEQTRDGSRVLVVQLAEDGTGETDPGALREVWLLTPDVTGLVSLGLLEGSTGTFAVPWGVDLAEYSVVDISAEPHDGNPAHSGMSVVRGSLRL